jgi:uncharacterized protein YhjY with autotransporter beta-barrel domain
MHRRLADQRAVEIQASGQCLVEASGSTGGRQVALGWDAGYSFHDEGLTFGPDLALDYTRIDVNGFTETDLNDSGLALAYGEQSGTSLLLKAGGHLSYALSTPIAPEPVIFACVSSFNSCPRFF